MAKKEKDSSLENESVADSLQWGLTLLKRSIRELMGSLEAIQKPLSESKKKLPKATSQLDRITEQTEQAASRVLDLVEQIGNHQSNIIDLLNESINKMHNIEGITPELIAKLEAAEEHANRSQNDTYTIMDAMQFQDITAQQINHAASLLEDVEGKIEDIVGQLDTGSMLDDEEPEKLSKKERIFDPKADMNVKQTDQTGVDDLVKSSRGRESK